MRWSLNESGQTRTLTSSLVAISLSCLVDGLDEEACEVEYRVEKTEDVLRDAVVYATAKRGIIATQR